MYLMYVDESGDSGLVNSPTGYYALTGLVVHELAWRPVLARLLAFRSRMRDEHGLKLREELHAAGLINDPGALVRIKRPQRLTIVREFADALAAIPELALIGVVVDKEGKEPGFDVFECAWRTMIRRLQHGVDRGSFPGAGEGNERAMIFPDHTDQKRLRELLRKLRVHDPVMSEDGTGVRNTPARHVIEDPVFRDSEDSYLIQAADLCAFLTYQHLAPSAYMRKKSGQNYLQRLSPLVHEPGSPGVVGGMILL